MTKIFGPSWRPKVAAIVGGIGFPGLFFLLTRYAHMTTTDATPVCTMIFAVLFSVGLSTTKQDNVSNSPTPLAVAQNVVPVTQPPQVIAPVILAHPVPIAPSPDVADMHRF